MALVILVVAGATAVVDARPAAAAGTASVTTIASSKAYLRYGQPLKLTSHVTGTGATPTGTVTFAAGATSLGSASLVAGTATLNIASLSTDLSVGVTATYGGDATFDGSVSSALVIGTLKNVTFVWVQPVTGSGPDSCQNIAGVPECLWKQPAANQITYEAVPLADNPAGEPYPTVVPTGSVTFNEIGALGQTLGSVPLVNGVATVTLPALPAGAVSTITANYPGDAHYLTDSDSTASVELTGPPPPPRWRFETNDGVGGNASGHLNADIGSGASSVTYAGAPHVFSYDQTNGNLRHAWYARGWHAETLDGAGADAFGRVDADVGRHTSALIYGGRPHVFYYDASNGNLRHAWWTGTRWGFEVLDGSASAVASGRSTGDVGETPAVSTYGIQVHVYSHDVSNGDLRHAWWDGTHWSSETLDGNTVDGSGRRNADVGRDVAVALFAGTPHAWYYDATNGDLRHGWWTGRQWRFETLDGDADVPSTGRVTGDLGQHPSVLLYGGLPHVWYHDASEGALRHAWWTGSRWQFEDLDGFGGFYGEVFADVGADATAMLYGGTPHVWYHDATFGYLRHAWWDGYGWTFEALDGFVGGDGRVSADVGHAPTVLAFNGQPHVWYHNTTNGSLRHAWYG